MMLFACLIAAQPQRPPGDAAQLGIKTAAAAGVLAGVCLLFQYIGAAAAMVACCVAMPILWGERRPMWIAAYATAYPAALYALFGMALNVRFPEGLWN